ncbi:MAG: hypothetical protein NC212_05995 [Staphylococcus sp.]|nr:hypothetical protein [Staphylococcus sp.]
MTRKEVTFTRIIRSRGMAVLFSLAAIFMTLQAYAFGKIPALTDFRTIAFPTPSDWLGDSWLSMIVNIALTLGVGGIMLVINRHFNLLRTSSAFFAAYFIFTMGCVPMVMGQLSASVFLALIIVGGIWLMFSVYNTGASNRRVFLMFFLIGLGQLVEYTFLFYVPLFIAGLGQMRILRFKKLLAAILGNVTPAWIVWGLGLADRPDLPVIEFTPPALILASPQSWPMLGSVVLSLLTGFFIGTLNLLKIIGFNAQARAYNGFLSLLSIATGIFAIVNFTNICFYVTLLNACVAFQVGHFFRFTGMRRGYVVVVSLMVAYLAIYTWAMLTPFN